jgi:hypothetical protein
LTVSAFISYLRSMKLSSMFLITFCLIWMLASGCSDGLHNYDECVQIETARCDVRAECQEDEAFDAAYPKFDRATCIAYIKEHCRTRKIAGKNWDQSDVNKCATAVTGLKDNCDALIPRGIDETEDLDECWFINGIEPVESDDDTDDTNKEDSETTSDNSSDAGD